MLRSMLPIVLLLFLVSGAFGVISNNFVNSYTITNTYNGREIKPDNLLELLEQEAPLSVDDAVEIQEFIEKYGLESILSGADYQEEMFTCSGPESGLRQAFIDNSILLYLQEMGVPFIHAPNSLVIVVNNKWLLKRSKVPIARQNVLDTLESIRLGKRSHAEWMRLLTREEYDQFIKLFDGKVYQNISRAMIYLRARQAARQINGNPLIEIPETHLVHIPGRPLDVEDRNYIVAEKIVKALTSPERESLQNSPLIVNEDFVLQMVHMIASTGWWTMNGSVIVVEGVAYYFDHELPNRHDIRHIFHKDVTHYRDLVKLGWSELEDRIKNYAQATHTDINELLEYKHALQQEIMDAWSSVCTFYPETTNQL